MVGFAQSAPGGVSPANPPTRKDSLRNCCVDLRILEVGSLGGVLLKTFVSFVCFLVCLLVWLLVCLLACLLACLFSVHKKIITFYVCKHFFSFVFHIKSVFEFSRSNLSAGATIPPQKKIASPCEK